MKDGGPAFPTLEHKEDKSLPTDVNGHHLVEDSSGMTMLDYFAGQALVGLMARTDLRRDERIAFAWEHAKALLEARPQ